MSETTQDGGFEFESSHASPEQIKASVSEPTETKTEPEVATSKEPPKEDLAKSDQRAETSEEKPAEKEDPKHSPRARMLQATQQAAAAKRERDAAQAEAAKLRSELDSIREFKEKQSAQNAEPSESDPKWKSEREFVMEHARWAARQEFIEMQARMQEERLQQQNDTMKNSRFDAFKAKMDAVSADNPKILDSISPYVLGLKPLSALEPGERANQSHVVAEEIFLSDNPFGVMQFLTQNPEDLRVLVSQAMSARDVARKVAAIEAKLEVPVTAGTGPKVEVSNAKPPVRPVTGSPHTAQESDDVSFEEHFRKENAKERKASLNR